MPEFTVTTCAAAPIEEVWKLLHDPSRFPEWWQGVETVVDGLDGVYRMWPVGFPDYPMDQRLSATPTPGRVTISCLVSDVVFTWELHPDGDQTGISVHVEIPSSEGHRLETQQRLITESLSELVRRASSEASPARTELP